MRPLTIVRSSRDLVVGEGRVDRAVHVVLVELADQERLAVLLDLPVDILRRLGKETIRLAQLELFFDPAVDEEFDERHAVLARHALRHGRHHVAPVQLRAADARQRRVAHEIAGSLPASGCEEQGSKRYFRTKTHFTDAQRYAIL